MTIGDDKLVIKPVNTEAELAADTRVASVLVEQELHHDQGSRN